MPVCFSRIVINLRTAIIRHLDRPGTLAEIAFQPTQHTVKFWAATGQESDAQDLVQEYFVKLAKNGCRATAAKNEKAWIFSVERNLLLDWQRQRRRTPRPGTYPPRQELELQLAAASDPDASYLGRELLVALTELPVFLAGRTSPN